MMLPEVYKDSIELFEKTFDVSQLVFDIITRVKNPATPGKLYVAEVVSVKNDLFKVKIEFKTEENTYFDTVLMENNAIETIAKMGFSLNNTDDMIGCKYNVFYENTFKVEILGKVNNGKNI